MGLSSALTTALTGLNAAETQIDVAGNNLANSQTVGFKASDVVFATQFLRTLSQGSAPADNTGGTNPRQMGLGVQVVAITPDFSQGTIGVSSSPSDLAIQGDGFFILEGNQGEQLYSRNGQFKTNSQNELVASTGHRLLGFGVDENYDLQATQLVPLTIPLGGAAAAQATENVYLNGNLTPTGDVATTAEVIESGVLGNGAVPRPDVNDPAGPMKVNVAAKPVATGTTPSSEAGGSSFIAGDEYEYAFTFVDGQGNETLRSQTTVAATVGANGDNIRLSNLPSSPLDGGSPQFDNLNIYRRQLGVPSSDPASEFHLIGNAAQGAGSFVDNSIAGGAQLDDSSLNGIYSYLVTFSGNGVEESRPSELLGPLSLVSGRVHIEDLPDIPTGDGVPSYDTINVYRNLSTSPDQFFLVTSLNPNGRVHRPSFRLRDLGESRGGPGRPQDHECHVADRRCDTQRHRLRADVSGR